MAKIIKLKGQIRVFTVAVGAYSRGGSIRQVLYLDCSRNVTISIPRNGASLLIVLNEIFPYK